MNGPVAYISLGSNLGDSRQLLQSALARLQDFSDEPVVCSSFWQTTPVDCPPGSPPFVNAVAGLRVRGGETPETLLQKLRGLEVECGRLPKQVLNEPRLLDLDLICFGAEIRHTPELTLPHPRAHQRKFVLQPLAEVAPDLILPGQNRSVRRLLAALPAGPEAAKLQGKNRPPVG
jgi:2-amino-4-hydroxy-6-hydroxymethyldihydropteridine diphosphokinase